MRTGAVARLLASHGRLPIGEVAARLGVAETALRADARQPDAGIRHLGKWLIPARLAADDGPAREDHLTARREAARAALPLINAGMRLFLDAGTTTPCLAEALPALPGLQVLTHSLAVAQILAARPEIGLTILSGEYHATTNAFYPARPDDRDFAAIDLAFLSAGGIADDGLITCSHMHEVAIKRAAITAAQRRYILADRSKLGRRRPIPFAMTDEMDGIISET